MLNPNELYMTNPEFRIMVEYNRDSERCIWRNDRSYEYRRLKDGKVLKVENMELECELAFILFEDEKRDYDYMVIPNPVEEKEIHNVEGFTRDEKRMKELVRIVLDIDYPFNDENVIKVLRVLSVYGIKLEHCNVYKTASGKMRFVIFPDSAGLPLERLIKSVKVFMYQVNELLKEEGLEIDNTFVWNINHAVFVEQLPIIHKGNRKSSLVYEVKEKYPVHKLLILEKEYEKLLEKKGKKSKPDKDGSGSKAEKKDTSYYNISRKEIEEYELYVYDIITNREKQHNLYDFNYRYYYFKRFFDYRKGSRVLKRNPYCRETTIWKIMRERMPDYISDYIVDLEYHRKVFKFFKEDIYSFFSFNRSYNCTRLRDTYRATGIIYPLLRLMVDCFGIEYTIENKLYLLVIDAVYYYTDKEKENLYDDIVKTLKQIEKELYNEDRKIDNNVNKYFSYKRIKPYIKVAQFFYDILQGKYDEYKTDKGYNIPKSILKKNYHLSKTAYRNFLNYLREYYAVEDYPFFETKESIIIEKILKPTSVYLREFTERIDFAGFLVNSISLYMEEEKAVFNISKDVVSMKTKDVHFYSKWNALKNKYNITFTDIADEFIKMRRKTKDKYMLIKALENYLDRIYHSISPSFNSPSAETGLPPVFCHNSSLNEGEELWSF